MKKLFVAGEQLDEQNKGSLGLGLHNTKQVIDAHDGRIWAESNPNEGTTFYVELDIVK